MACLDVFYRELEATSACVLFNEWPDSKPAGEIVRRVSPITPYEPGNFYRRELPCLLDILAELPQAPELVIVDAYVWLDSVGRPGLGARLHAELGGRIPVIGVAKSHLQGAPAIPVIRGKSRSPLFVSSAGIEPREAALRIAQMDGQFRIPTLLRRVDRLCRDSAAPAEAAPST
jgi:deoxyribonuclease V